MRILCVSKSTDDRTKVEWLQVTVADLEYQNLQEILVLDINYEHRARGRHLLASVAAVHPGMLSDPRAFELSDVRAIRGECQYSFMKKA